MLSKLILSLYFFLSFGYPGLFCLGQNLTLQIDTLSISYNELEAYFIKNNFQLLSQKYNIAESEAAIKQARLYANPIVSYENVAYNPNNHRWFDNSGQNGERQLQLQQLIYLGGKRSQLIKMAEINKSINEYAFYDLLRCLRYQLISDYALVYSDLEKLNLLNDEAVKLSSLVSSFKLQVTLGSISEYELTRVEYELNNLRSDINDLYGEIAEAQNRLRVMTQLKSFIKPKELIFTNNDVTLSPITDSAYAYRPDLKLAANQVNLMNRNLGYQKALSIPDITVGGNYDRYGNAFPNYTGINISLNLPAFNRNQGNIKIAEAEHENAKLMYEFNKTTITQEVEEAYSKYIQTRGLYRTITPDYEKRLLNISDEAITRYNQRIIGLLDFVDKMKTYKEGRLSVVEIELDYFISCQYLNLVTNTKLF